MKYFALRGVARSFRSINGAPAGSLYTCVGLAFATDPDDAIEAIHQGLKSYGLALAAIDGSMKEIPADQADEDTEQGRDMRAARDHGPQILISSEPSDCTDIDDSWGRPPH